LTRNRTGKYRKGEETLTPEGGKQGALFGKRGGNQYPGLGNGKKGLSYRGQEILWEVIPVGRHPRRGGETKGL